MKLLRTQIATCLIALCLSVHAFAEVTAAPPVIKDLPFRSASLEREMRYRIYLPPGYASSAKRYPVLYLLHGLYGDYTNWDKLTQLSTYMAGRSWIVVMPDAGNSWYVNSVSDPRDRFEDYIAKDIVAEIDQHFRTLATRPGRAVAGLSMGGYAAMKLALKYPDRYVFAGSMSGAFDAAENLANKVPEFHDQLIKVLGESDNPARIPNDVFALLKDADPSRLPYLYVTCGTADPFLAVNRDFVKDLPARKIVYEYHETPGAHDWQFWDRAVKAMLVELQSRFTQ